MPPIGPPLLCPTLIGRDEPLGALVTALDGAIAGHGRSALIAGEAGIGKTALLRRFIDVARERGARAAVGECIEIEAKRPLGPFIDIVDDLARAGILRPGVARPDLESGQVDEEQRYRVYLSFATLFTALGRTAPLVVVVEDLHWADEATLELFGYLARKLRDGRVLLVGTYRSDELHRLHPLRPLLAELARARLADEIRVERLSPVELSRFLRETMRRDSDPSPAFRDAMQDRCEGNPLFVEEVLKALQQAGDLELKDGQWHRTREVAHLALPDSIGDAVQARLRPLTPRARRALQIAAVIGQTFEFELLREVSRATEEDLARDLRTAIDAQIVIVPTDGASRFAFRHALTRESVLAELLESERRELHQAIGQAIESAENEPLSRAEELAYHFDEARDHDRAFRYRVHAAELARRSAAFSRAARHLERAVALAPAGENVAALYLRLAEAAHLAGDIPRAVRAAGEAARVYQADGELLRAGAALCLRARTEWQLADPAAGATAREAVRLLEPLGRTAELAAAYAEVARANVFLDDDPESARGWAERAVEIARETDSGPGQSDILITLGLALATADGQRAADLTREGIEIAKRADLPITASRGYVNLWNIVLWHPQLRIDPREVYAEALDFYQRSGHQLAAFQWLRAGHALGEGDFDAVLAVAAETPEETNYGRMLELHTALVVRIARDGPEGIVSAIPVTLGKGSGVTGLRFEAVGRATIELLAGDFDAALAAADAVADRLDPKRAQSGMAVHLVVAAIQAARGIGDRAAVERWSARAHAWASSGFLGSIVSRYATAEENAERGDARAAAALFGEAADANVLTPILETVGRLRRTEMLLRFDRAAADAELARVVAFWQKGKASWYLHQLASWASSHKMALPETTHPPKPKQTLTERERDVARLVAEGLSNKEIAERLVVSERTAEGHVQRILDKLNFRSRTQIAVWEAESRTGAGRA